MTTRVESEPIQPASPTLLTEMRTIWSNAFRIFFRKFSYLEDELAAATWPRFLLTIFTTIFLGSGVYHLLLGLFYKVIFERSVPIAYNLAAYWVVETAWGSVNAAIVDIPFILLVAYLSYYWVSHTKEENTHWIQEAQMLAVTWTITSFCSLFVHLIGIIVIFFTTRDPKTFALRTNLQTGTLTILNYLFFGLLTAPIVAYRYNLWLHGNKTLNGLTGRDRWLLLGFQIVMLEGGTAFVIRLISHLPAIESLYQSLLRYTA